MHLRWLWVSGVQLAEGLQDGCGWQGSSWPEAPKMVVGGRGPAGRRPPRWLWVAGVQLAGGPQDGCGWQGFSWSKAPKMVVGDRGLAPGPKRGHWPIRRQSCCVVSNPKLGLRFINGP